MPEGSRAMAGIGCHGMALSVPNRRTATISHMGAEGVNWIGQAPFTTEQHVFQNLGDGTYSHTGLLAIRAAAAAGVNITYKILYNDAVAMTGGQPAEGGLTVSQIAHQVSAEGAKRLVIVSDEPEKYPSNYFPSGATVHHRRELDAVQKELREVKGLTVLIYDQTCAAEKRRRRKRGLYPDPPKRVFINERVCEGCGDCSAVSNCVSVQPLETEFGRKRRIDQSNCNKDFSCIEGFCPSFVTVHGGKLRKADRTAADPSALFADLPAPATPALDGAYNILVTGIGGTGVITIGALLGMAAHVEGMGCSTLDFTGLAQKNGAVMSHVLHADLEIGENDGIGERLEFTQPPVQRGFRPVAADRRGAAQNFCAVALGHADRANGLARLRLFDIGLDFLALEGGVAIMRGQAAGLEPGLAPDPLAQRRELAEMGRPFDGAALKPELLGGRVVMDRGMGIVDLGVEHLLRAPPWPDEQIVALQDLRRERRF